ncbi:flippase [Candidatus Woesearchaeota archaeon]|nr:flippase [Candidatus Woesearchaeota archaeon]
MAVSKSLEKIANGALIVIISMIFGKLFSYLYVVLVANKLGSADYGILSISFAILSFLSALSILGLDEGIIRYVSFFRGKNDKNAIKGTILTSIKTVFNSSIIFGVLLIVFSDFITNDLFNEYKLMKILIFIAIALPFSTLSQLFLVSFRAFQKPKYETLLKEIIEKSIKFLTAFILITMGYKLIGVVFAYLLTLIITLMLSSYLFNKKIFNLFDSRIKSIENKKELLNYSLPLLLKNFMWFIIGWIDILMIGIFKFASDAGVYSVALQTSNLIIMPAYSVMYLFLPVISELYGKNSMDEIKNIYKKISKYIMIINIPVFIIMLVLAKDILAFMFKEEYTQAVLPLIILSVGYLAFSLSDISMNILSVMKKTKIISMIIFLFAFVNAVLNYILIPKYGIIGAAIATSSSFVVGTILMMSVTYHYSKLHPFMFNYSRIILSSLLTLIAALFVKNFVSYSSLTNMIFFPILILSVYLLLLLITRTFDKEDADLLKDIKNKLMLK